MREPGMRFAAWIVVAFVAGFGVAALLAPRFFSAPQATEAPPPPPSITPSPTPDADDPQALLQPLVAGCGANDEAYVVSRGGGIARFDGRHWRLIDDTLRDLRAVACTSDLVLAVGDGGRVVRIDTARREIRSDVVTDADLYAVALVDSNTAYVAGDRQVVMRFASGRWERLGRGEEGSAWRAILARRPNEVWFAGDHGALFLFDGRTFQDRSVADGANLVFIGQDVQVVTADGRLLEIVGDTTRLTDKRDGLRAVYFFGGTRYVLLADRIVVGDTVVPTGLMCPPRAMFAGSRELFVLARDDGRVGIARSLIGGGTWTKGGSC